MEEENNCDRALAAARASTAAAPVRQGRQQRHSKTRRQYLSINDGSESSDDEEPKQTPNVFDLRSSSPDDDAASRNRKPNRKTNRSITVALAAH